jgi:hypothetical protein
MSEAQARGILTERRAKLLTARDPLVYPDGTVSRYWERIPEKDINDCAEFAETIVSEKNKSAVYYVDEPLIGGRKKKGRWRVAFVETRRERDDTYTLIQTLAEGFRTTVKKGDAIDWAWARVVTGRKLLGNSESATGVSNTTSNNPERYITVRFTGISPEATSAVLGELSDASYSDFNIRGENYSDTWRNIFANVTTGEDGSATVDMLLARPQYTLNAYHDFGGSEERGVTYLWNVPKDLAQGIMTSWKTGVGKTATASYGKEAGMVDIVLQAKVGIPENLTISDIAVNCDTTLTMHFAWGYTEAQVETFIQAHDSASAGLSRQVKVDTRGDGYYDVVIEERTFGPHGEDVVDFSLELPIGTKVTQTNYYGYNIRISELSYIRSNIEANSAEVGKSYSFQITREDDCSFDYVAVVRVVTQIDKEMTIPAASDGGVQVEVRSSIFARGDTLPAQMTAAAGKRVRVKASLQAQEDETVTASVERTTVPEVTLDKNIPAVSGTEGEAMRVYSGKNVDEANIAAALVSVSARERLLLVQITPNEDKTYDYIILKRTEQAPEGSIESSIGAEGLGSRIKTGVNVSASALAAVATAFASGARKRVNFSLSANGDGTFNYAAEETTVQRVLKSDIILGKKFRKVYRTVGKNADAADIPAVSDPPTDGRTYEQRIQANDDETYDFLHDEERAVEKTAQSRIYNGRGTRVIDRTENASAADASVGEANKEIRVIQERDDDGFYNIEKQTFTPTAANSAGIILYDDGIVRRTLTLYFNQSAVPAGEPGVEILQPTYNDFDLYDYIKITTTILAASVVINQQAVTQEERSPVRTRFQTGVLQMWEFFRYRNTTQTITRYFYTSKQEPPAATSAYGYSNHYRAGYDDKRGVYFIDHDYRTFGAWYGQTLEKTEIAA